MKLPSRRLLLAALAVLTLTVPSATHAQSTFEVFRLAADSPLATDGSLVFGIADDQRTVLVGSGAGGDWKVLARRPTPRRVSGLAWDRGVLYLADDEARGVYRLPLDPTGANMAAGRPDEQRRAEPLVVGAPLVQPRDLAFSGGVIVGDPGAGAVFRIDREKKTVDTVASGLPPGPMYVAADRRGMVVTSPDAGEVRQPASFEGSNAQRPASSVPFSVWRTRERTRPDSSGPPSNPQRRFPLIERPTALAVARGSVYLIDAADGSVYVAFREQPRPMRVAAATPIKRPTRLLTLGDSLLVLDGSRGVLDRWPLPVPTEIELGADVAKALDALYGYLQQERVLPTRKVPWRGSLEETLKGEGIAGAGGPTLSTVTCALNPTLCRGGAWTTAGGTITILVPDLPIESVIDLETIDVGELGERTLGQEVDRRIVSPVFHEYRNEDELWELNASRLTAVEKNDLKAPRSTARRWGPFRSQGLRNLKADAFPARFSLTIPVEKVRCLVALPRRLLVDDAGLSRIRLLSRGFNWNPLEEGEAKAYSIQPPEPIPPPQPCDVALLTRQHADLFKIIHHKAPAVVGSVTVGVVEEKGIDVGHAAFGDPVEVFMPLDTLPAAAAAAEPPPLTCKAGAGEDDHGTAIASLIAARPAPAGHGLQGIAPTVRIVPVRSTDEFVGEDLLNAFRAPRRVRIFNLSLHYRDKTPLNIRLKVNQLKEALFVVAAGNDATDQKPVCESARPYPAYPVCEGYRKNVLVVAATNADGVALIERTENPPTPGSNWNDRLVHIAAPGTGFHAAGRNNTYVPVRGTSFATPLVSATAALLYAQGVTDPWLLKQRIIATADQRDSLIGKVFGAGLLNVERAITAPRLAVLGTTDPPTTVALEDDQISIKWPGGARTLPLSNVRRLTKTLGGQSYRIVYLDDVTDTLVIQDDVDPGPWTFHFKRVNAAGVPTGAPLTEQLENFRDYVGPIL